MDILIKIIWRIDYPLQLLLCFIPFILVIKKKKNFYIPLIIGIVALFGFWQIRMLSFFETNSYSVIPLYLITAGLLYLTIFFVFDIDAFASLFVLTFIITIQHISYELGLIIINLINYGLFGTGLYLLISYGILLVNSCGLFLFAKYYISKNINYTNSFIDTISFAIAILTEIILSIIEKEIFDLDIEKRVLVSTIMSINNLLVSFFIIFTLYISAISNKRKEENLVLSLIAEKSKERFNMAKITIDEINIKYHDLKHMLNDNKLNEEDTKEIKETLTNYKTIIQTSNQGLNVVVYETQLKCISSNIDFNVLVDGDVLKGFSSHHVYTLLSNLLDNAIEALLKIDDISKRRMSLNIKKVRESCIIIVENYFDKKINIPSGSLPKTSKEKHTSSHGFGLKSVSRIVDKYNGVLSIESLDNNFIVKIIFPLRDI